MCETTKEAPQLASKQEPADDLTQAELERGITMLRRLKRGEIEFMFGQNVRGGLYLKEAPVLR